MRGALHVLLALAAAFGLLACSASSGAAAPGDGGACKVGFLGDGGAVDFEILVLQPDDTVTPVVDGGTVPLVFPPQGGRVIFAGVRATNVDGCALQVTGALRDLKTNEVQVDSRTTQLVPVGGGWGVSGQSGPGVSAANFSNVAVCPNEWSSTNVYGTTYGLEVTVTDREGRQLTRKVDVVPQCAQPENQAACECICMGGYVLGQVCDAGAG